ncbi:MAG: hypothetical protein DMG76_33880 [Acidobacteria bacterium]|nr:MAG: hypothetical protein DMG76_33880 [Acidobacteriota bacterium]
MSYLYFAGVVTKMNARFRDNTVAEADRWRAAVKNVSCEAVAREKAVVAGYRFPCFLARTTPAATR